MKRNKKWGLAVSQPHCAPVQHGDLIARSADFHCFALCVDAVALVNVVDTIGKPHAAVAAVGFDRIDCFACALGFHAFGSNLPAGFVGDGLAVFERQPVVILELEDRADVNH